MSKLFIKALSLALLTVSIPLFTIGCGATTSTDSTSSSETKVDSSQPKDEPAPTKTDSTTTKKAITIVLDGDGYAPYEYKDENQKDTGINYDIYQEVFKKMGYTVNIKCVPFSRGLELVKNGETDALSGSYKTSEREVFADYPSESNYSEVGTFFVRKDSPITFDGDFNKIKTNTIGVINGYSAGSEFDKAVKDKILKTDETQTNKLNIDKLLVNKVDIIVGDKYCLLSTLKQSGALDKVKELSVTLQSEPAYLMFSKKSNMKDTITEYDKTLKEIKNNGIYQKILDKYIK